jgi:copper chaperone CopZ
VRDALLSVPGVRNVEVSFHDQEATVDYDPAEATLAGMIAAIEGLGFQAWDTATEKRALPAPTE